MRIRVEETLFGLTLKPPFRTALMLIIYVFSPQDLPSQTAAPIPITCKANQPGCIKLYLLRFIIPIILPKPPLNYSLILVLVILSAIIRAKICK